MSKRFRKYIFENPDVQYIVLSELSSAVREQRPACWATESSFSIQAHRDNQFARGTERSASKTSAPKHRRLDNQGTKSNRTSTVKKTPVLAIRNRKLNACKT
jgi:hypothetical protein